jgi:hypothetical protein
MAAWYRLALPLDPEGLTAGCRPMTPHDPSDRLPRRAPTRRGPWGALALLAYLAAAPAVHGASPDALADADAKAEYAYFTEDRSGLEHLAAELKSFRESSDPAELYAYAQVQFRRLQLAAVAHAAKDADNAGDQCVAALDRRLALVPKDAEGHALQAICAGYLAELGGLKRLLASHRRDASLEAAQAEAPNNPRVLLASGLIGWFNAKPTPAARAQTRATLARAAALFEEVKASEPGDPTWGGAEAWLFVGRGLEEDGNLVGARNAYERALLVAPDFAAARRHMKRLAQAR